MVPTLEIELTQSCCFSQKAEFFFFFCSAVLQCYFYRVIGQIAAWQAKHFDADGSLSPDSIFQKLCGFTTRRNKTPMDVAGTGSKQL